MLSFSKVSVVDLKMTLFGIEGSCTRASLGSRRSIPVLLTSFSEIKPLNQASGYAKGIPVSGTAFRQIGELCATATPLFVGEVIRCQTIWNRKHKQRPELMSGRTVGALQVAVAYLKVLCFLLSSSLPQTRRKLQSNAATLYMSLKLSFFACSS